jgi:hypothetical protein
MKHSGHVPVKSQVPPQPSEPPQATFVQFGVHGVGVRVAVAVAVGVGVLVGGTAVLVTVGVGVLVGGTAVLVGVAVAVLVGGTAVFVGVAVAVAVGLLVGVLVAVAVFVGVGVGCRQEPFTHCCPAVQHVVPHGVVPASQVQRRRPLASGAPHVPEQHVSSRTQLYPPARQIAAAPCPERSTLVAGTLATAATTAPPTNRRSSARRLPPAAKSRVMSSKRPPSISTPVLAQSILRFG